jgi:hypothetical protein
MFNGQSFFWGGAYLGGFFEEMFKEMEREQQKQINKEAGIEINENGLFGVPIKNIPFKFHAISFVKEHYFCKKDETKTLYDQKGCYVFSGEKFKMLGKNMFLVKQKEDKHYSLFKNFQRLSEPIFSAVFSSKFESDFCILNIYEKDSLGRNCVIDTDGNVILRTDGCLRYLSLKGNLATSEGVYYNLKKGGEIICRSQSYKGCLEVDGFIFVQEDKCVYKINTMTGEFETFGTPTPPKPEPEPKPKYEKTIPSATKPNPIEPNRNDPCPCGSGKKYKHCGLQQKCEKTE